eukprot:GHVS01082962.1.p2 GENE.GHVS01082962.1~~GHVS01082962.1.p2  ORF type:complete len:103 (-),score=21.13 GHVS01082962.1:111-419(-)
MRWWWRCLGGGGGAAAIQFRVDSPPRRLSMISDPPCNRAVKNELCYYASKMSDCMMKEASGDDADLTEKMDSYLKLWTDNAKRHWYCGQPTRAETIRHLLIS